MKNRTFVLVHNIPSPYRLHLFQALSDRLALRGCDFRVLMMARQHWDRPHWPGDIEGKVRFKVEFFRDCGTRIRSKEWHFNPGILATLAREQPDYVMLGGPWDSLTGAALSLLPFGRKRIAWFEGNTKTPGMVTGSARKLKQALLATYDYMAVPGKEGIGLAQLIVGSESASRCVLFPNLVEESRFKQRERGAASMAMRSELLSDPHRERLAIWNARLTPAKGVPDFIACLSAEDLSGWRLVIFGEGPLEALVRDRITASGLGDRVVLRPYVSYEAMPDLYHAADLFVLPSLEDPNPLSIVEAMHSGLPLLVSDRIGNHPEAIDEGRNGWTIDPCDCESVRRGIRAAFGADCEQLRTMGQRSRELADLSWNTVRSIDHFLDAIGIESCASCNGS